MFESFQNIHKTGLAGAELAYLQNPGVGSPLAGLALQKSSQLRQDSHPSAPFSHDGPPKFADLLNDPGILKGFCGDSSNSLSQKLDSVTKSNASVINNSNKSAEGEGGINEDVKAYIDERIKDLERTLVDKIDEAEKRTSAKLDLILQMLSKENNS